MNDLGSTRLLTPGKPLAMAISLVIIIILDTNHGSWIVSVDIVLGQFPEFTKGQLAVIGRRWNSTQKTTKTKLPGERERE